MDGGECAVGYECEVRRKTQDARRRAQSRKPLIKLLSFALRASFAFGVIRAIALSFNSQLLTTE